VKKKIDGKKYEEENKVGEWKRMQKYINRGEGKNQGEKKRGGRGKNTPY
jgi:hypothetical protein